MVGSDGPAPCNGGLCFDRTKGRLEVFMRGVWGTVCDDYFGNRDAEVVCRSLGLGGGVVGDTTGPTSMPILMDNVQCVGNEHSIFDCQSHSTHNCNHHEDVYITCSGELKLESQLAS